MSLHSVIFCKFLLLFYIFSCSTEENIPSFENDISNHNEYEIHELDDANGSNLHSLNENMLPTVDLRIGTKIIGGTIAQRFQFPYQSAIYIFGRSGRILFCGGAIISEKFVLTAAHCIFETPKRIMVIMGNENLLKYSKFEIRRDAEKYIIHRKFDRPELRHDICLLQLKGKLVYNKAIKPIQLPTSGDVNTNFLNRYATVSGFGKTIDGGPLSTVLMYEVLRIMDIARCNEYFEDRDASRTNICTTGVDGRGACQGDSGGPLVIDKKLIGLVSFGARYCSLGYPSVYTRVPSYVKWIANYTNIPIQ